MRGTDLFVQSCRGHPRFRVPGACQSMQYFRHSQTLSQDRVFWMQLNVDFYNFVSIVDVLVSKSFRPRRDCLRTCARKVKVKVVRICRCTVKTLSRHRLQEQVQGTHSIHGRSSEPTTPHPTECKYPSSLFGVLVVRRLGWHLPVQVVVGAVALYTLFATTTWSVHSSVQSRRPSHRGQIRSLLSPLTTRLPSEHLTHAAALAVVARFLHEDLHSHHSVDGDFPLPAW